MIEQSRKKNCPKFKWDRNQRDYHKYRKMKLAKLFDLELGVKFQDEGSSLPTTAGQIDIDLDEIEKQPLPAEVVIKHEAPTVRLNLVEPIEEFIELSLVDPSSTKTDVTLAL